MGKRLWTGDTQRTLGTAVRAVAFTAALVVCLPSMASPKRLATLEDLLERVRAEPESPARWGEEARVLHYLAEATRDSDAKDRYRKEGLKVAERALARDPESPPALLWWCAHRGAEATALNPVQAVKIALEIEERLLKLRKVAPEFDESAADRVLGLVYQVAPPVVSIGSMKKARFHLAEALKRHPDHPGNLLLNAKLRLEDGDCREAEKLARKVLASGRLKDPFDGDAWRAEADRLIPRAIRACR